MIQPIVEGMRKSPIENAIHKGSKFKLLPFVQDLENSAMQLIRESSTAAKPAENAIVPISDSEPIDDEYTNCEIVPIEDCTQVLDLADAYMKFCQYAKQEFVATQLAVFRYIVVDFTSKSWDASVLKSPVFARSDHTMIMY